MFLAESSGFFNSFNGDRRYSANEFAQYFTNFIGNGIFGGGAALQVNATSGHYVSVNVGKGFINGYAYENSGAPKVLQIQPPHPVLPRYDAVVLRLDLGQTVRKISAVIKTGVAKDNPVAPELERGIGVYELLLANIYVGANVSDIFQRNISDCRFNSSKCGIVTGLVDQIDFSTVFSEYYDALDRARLDWTLINEEGSRNWYEKNRDFEAWFVGIKATIYNQMSSDFDDWSRKSGFDFETYFESSTVIQEDIINSHSSNQFASRRTEFLPNDEIKTTLQFYDPPLTVTKTTHFYENRIVENIL